MSYGLLFGTLSLLGFSMYYFTGYLSKTLVHNNINTLPNAEKLTERIIENLNVQSITSPDTIVPKLSSETLESIMKIESAVQTEPIVKTTTDSGVQTDINMLYEYLKELLYNQGTPTTSLGEISPSDFVREYRNNPELAQYFQNTLKWAESVGDPRLLQSNSSEYKFLLNLKEAIGSNNSSLSNLNLSLPKLNDPIIPYDMIEIIRSTKIEELLNDNTMVWTPYKQELLRMIVESWDIGDLMLQSCNNDIIGKLFFMTMGC